VRTVDIGAGNYVVCRVKNTRNGFKHTATLFREGFITPIRNTVYYLIAHGKPILLTQYCVNCPTIHALQTRSAKQ
jgi:hypothetical protein